MLSILNFQILVRQAPRRDDAGIDTGNDWLIGIFLNASVQRTSAEVMSAWPASLLLAWYRTSPDALTTLETCWMSCFTLSMRCFANLTFCLKTKSLRASYIGVLFAPVKLRGFILEETCLFTYSASMLPMPPASTYPPVKCLDLSREATASSCLLYSTLSKTVIYSTYIVPFSPVACTMAVLSCVLPTSIPSQWPEVPCGRAS